jgi:glutathione synthase/RimK-type ligase-like ATP-grasp enzyme
MVRRRTDVALLTDRRYTAPRAEPGDWYLGNILADDALLAAALGARGVSSRRVDWADPSVDFSAFRALVFRTTWDYYDRQAEFAAWLDRVSPVTRLVNDVATVRWNLDKHYLADLAAAGVPTVPTRFVARGEPLDPARLLADEGWHEGVVKPAVSGGARHTHRFTAESAAAVGAAIAPLLAEEAFLVQRFEAGILDHGEDTLVVVEGRFTHALTKRARPGDFRVQDDHGGTVHPCTPSPEQIDLATRAMAVRGGTAYGRVDMVRRAEGGWAVMELELIEPELWLRRFPPAAEALAEAIVRRLD